LLPFQARITALRFIVCCPACSAGRRPLRELPANSRWSLSNNNRTSERSRGKPVIARARSTTAGQVSSCVRLPMEVACVNPLKGKARIRHRAGAGGRVRTELLADALDGAAVPFCIPSCALTT